VAALGCVNTASLEYLRPMTVASVLCVSWCGEREAYRSRYLAEAALCDSRRRSSFSLLSLVSGFLGLNERHQRLG
jgi:hypothetical protein